LIYELEEKGFYGEAAGITEDTCLLRGVPCFLRIWQKRKCRAFLTNLKVKHLHVCISHIKAGNVKYLKNESFDSMNRPAY